MRWRLWWKTFGGILLAAALLFLAAWMKNPCEKYTGATVENREYYLFSASSQAAVRKALKGNEVFSLTGEAVTLRFSDEAEASRYMDGRLRDAGVQIVAEERVEGARSVYAYERGGGFGVRLFGRRVNLHLVQRGSCVRVGSPVVFGGY